MDIKDIMKSDVPFHKYEFYSMQAQKIFDFFNGNDKINPLNVCQLNLGMYSNYDLGMFIYPNIVTIFVGTIVDAYDDGDHNGIMSELVTTIIHELYHADQPFNILNTTKNYVNYIESYTDMCVYRLIALNKEDIEKLFGFKFDTSPCICSEDVPKLTVPQFVTNLLVGTFGISALAGILDSIYDKYDTIIIDLKNLIEITIKENGAYSFSQAQILSACLNQFKHGDAHIEVVCNVEEQVCEEDPHAVRLFIEIEEYHYNPISFK